ncbi:MAG: YbjN domain-containing protein [Leptolyngbya sp. SIO4C5]|nr:YbjN domain-containing protein [Leptolyngbya sp. SIO4C5]
MTQLIEQTNDSNKAINYLQELNQKQSKNLEEIHPLLQEQNWYCTAIKQQQPDGEIGYTTLWHYLLPALQNPTSEAIADSITQYIQDQTAASFDQITQATEPLFKDIAQSFQDLFTTTLADLEAAEDAENSEQSSLLSSVKDFFEAEDWPYAQLSNSASEGTTTLRLAFRGENGQWPCYVNVNQAQETACFYSISPATTPLEQRGAIAEFITRANYGLILGNFELDYTDGEIRYKTSIDVEGDRLSPALIHNLVYTNVLTMDQYLPGLMAVLEQGISPEQAIALVEQSQPATSAESATESNPIDRLVW